MRIIYIYIYESDDACRFWKTNSRALYFSKIIAHLYYRSDRSIDRSSEFGFFCFKVLAISASQIHRTQYLFSDRCTMDSAGSRRAVGCGRDEGIKDALVSLVRRIFDLFSDEFPCCTNPLFISHTPKKCVLLVCCLLCYTLNIILS